MEELLSLRGVHKSFAGVHAVDGVSFTLSRGTILGLLGRNGAGKTTTLRIITGVFLPDAGQVRVLGADPGRSRDRIGYLPEERGLYRTMRVQDQLVFLARLKGFSRERARAAADAWLERFELLDRRNALLGSLSKGNQQKVQLIGALLHDPDLVVLDEPMTALDPVNVVLVREILSELRNEGKAVLLSTHLMAEAEKLVDEIVVLDQGRLVLAGALDEVRRGAAADRVHIGFEGDGAFLADLPGVLEATVSTHAAELRIAPDADPQRLLAAALARVRVLRFELSMPSLEELFLARVAPPAPALVAHEQDELAEVAS